MSDILRMSFFFGDAEYLWGIAVDPVFALLVWIVPSLRKKTRAGEGVPAPWGGLALHRGMRKPYLAGITHRGKARLIP